MWVLGLCVGALAHIFLGCTDDDPFCEFPSILSHSYGDVPKQQVSDISRCHPYEEMRPETQSHQAASFRDYLPVKM